MQNAGRSKQNPSLQRSRNFQRVSGILIVVLQTPHVAKTVYTDEQLKVIGGNQTIMCAYTEGNRMIQILH